MIGKKGSNEKAILIATEPLTNEKWIIFEKNKLYEFVDGELTT